MNIKFPASVNNKLQFWGSDRATDGLVLGLLLNSNPGALRVRWLGLVVCCLVLPLAVPQLLSYGTWRFISRVARQGSRAPRSLRSWLISIWKGLMRCLRAKLNIKSDSLLAHFVMSKGIWWRHTEWKSKEITSPHQKFLIRHLCTVLLLLLKRMNVIQHLPQGRFVNNLSTRLLLNN